jgi:hypothetical protein
MTVPYQFARATGTLPLNELDANFSAVANNVATANTVVFGHQPNITAVGTLANLTATGNVVGGLFIGDGSLLTNLNIENVVGLYGNANVASYLPTDTTILSIQNNVANTASNVANLTTSVTGIDTSLINLTASVTGIASNLVITNSNVADLTLATANAFVDTNSDISNLSASTTAEFAAVNSNIANLTSATANAFADTNGTVANNASNITILQGQVYTNANVADYLPTNGTITLLQGNDVALQTQVASLTGQVYTDADVAAYLPTYSGNIGAANAAVVVNSANVNFNMRLGAPVVGGTNDKIRLYNYNNPASFNYAIGAEAGNIWFSAPYASTSGFNFYNTDTLAVHIGTNGSITATGNVAAPYFIGDGSQLTNLPAGNYANANVADYLPTYTGNLTAGNINVLDNLAANSVNVTHFVTAPVALNTLTAVAGARAFVNDSELVADGNFGAQIAGGGADTVPVWSDGTNWYIG